MRDVGTIRVIRKWAAALAWGVAGAAAPSPAADADPRVELHALQSRQIELSVSVDEQQRRVNGCIEDPSLTSPEIAALRKQLELMRRELAAAEAAAAPDPRRADLRRDFTSTQALLRAKIEALPEVRALIERMDADRRTLQESGRRIRELRESVAK